MKETKLKQYLYEHPHLLDDAFEVSLTEANKWAKENKLSVMDVIALAKEKHPDISSKKWAAFEKVAKQSEQRNKQDKKGSIVHIRWWQVAVAVIILIVLTFTLVPPARAFAESIIRYIVSIFDGGIDIHQEGEMITHWTPSPEELNLTIENNTEHNYYSATYPDVATFTAETGYKPVLIISDAFTITNIEYQSVKNAFDSLCITYNYNEITIYVWQTWGNERGESLFEDENDVLIRTTTLDGKEVIGYEDRNEGCSLEILLDESNMTIMYFGDLDYVIVLDALQYTE
jgi:hypothetical protein